MNRPVVKVILQIFGLALFSLALWALCHELRMYHPKDIVEALSLALLLRPHPRPVASTVAPHLAQLESVVRQPSDCGANLAFLSNRQFIFSRNGGSFIIYGQSGRSYVGMGDPVGPGGEQPKLIWSFWQLADRHGCWAMFHEVSAGEKLTATPYRSRIGA